ncbi:hypothetical protein ACTL6U_18250 [Rhodovibrionaceae bacterium A322]
MFFKAHKVAGTSVEIALSVHASDQDIVTPIGTPDELNRLDWTGVTPRNWANSKEVEEAYNADTAALLKDISQNKDQAEAKIQSLLKKFKTYYRAQARFYNHITPAELTRNGQLPEHAEATKVTIARHPYEQLVSQAFFRAQKKEPDNPDRDLNQYIDYLLSQPSKNEAYYLQDGKALCDIYLRHEHLTEDLKKLEASHGLALVDRLPRTKHHYRTDRRPAREILTDSQKERCYERCRREFEFFAYDSC